MAISTRTPSVTVIIEYTARGANPRVRKFFTDLYAARRFYAAKLKAGANPRVRKLE